MRLLEWDDGRVEARTHRGVRVRVDEEERRMLDPGKRTTAAARANAHAVRTAVQLHMEHHFTDGWAKKKVRGWAKKKVHGSKKKVRGSDGREETRVACGATEGAVPVEPVAGESAAREALRSIGAGLIGCRLPAPMEVVDAELYAVLMALRATAER